MYIVTLILILVVSTLVAFKGFFKDKPPNKKEKLILIYFYSFMLFMFIIGLVS